MVFFGQVVAAVKLAGETRIAIKSDEFGDFEVEVRDE